MKNKYLDEKEKNSPEPYTYKSDDSTPKKEKDRDLNIDFSNYRKIRTKARVVGHVQEQD